MKKMRAKFKVSFVKDYGNFAEVELDAICDDGTEENSKFCKYTPIGKLTMSIDREGAKTFLKPDKEYYLDFIECDETNSG